MLFKNLSIDEFKKFHPEFNEDVFADLQPLNVVKSKISEGGTGFTQVEKEVNNWQEIVNLNLNYFSTTRVYFEVE